MTIFDLTGKVVWVTGASRGLGRAIATSLARAGATIAATARSGADLAALAAGLEPGVVDVFPASVDDAAAVRSVVAAIVSRHGRLDGLVNCAGISPTFTRSEQLADEDWQRTLAVNLTGTFLCCREAGRVMLAQGSGSIVNVTSVHATVGAERLAAYVASKGGVHMLTKALAVEWAERGVRVNALAPGYFHTDLSRDLLESRHGERIRNGVPMKRIGDADELGASAVYLISDASAYVTGSALSVDGGWQAV